MEYKILIIDDEEENLVNQLKKSLEIEDCEVVVLDNDEDVIKNISLNVYSMVIFDMWFPGSKNNLILKKIRDTYSIPIIIWSNNKDKHKIIMGLNMGADDYISKTLDIDEATARIMAIIRRSYEFNTNKKDKVKIGDMIIDISSRKVSISGKFVDLTSKEYDILHLLITNRGKVYDRETLLQLIWGYDYYGDSRTVDVHVRRLREKIEKDPSNPQYVLTKWGVGYYYRG